MLVCNKQPNSTHAQMREAGEKALVGIYIGKKGDSLNMLRYKKYSEKVATSLSRVDPKNLPLISAAAKFHCYCFFLSGKTPTVTCCQNHGDGKTRWKSRIKTDPN